MQSFKISRERKKKALKNYHIPCDNPTAMQSILPLTIKNGTTVVAVISKSKRK